MTTEKDNKLIPETIEVSFALTFEVGFFAGLIIYGRNFGKKC